MINAIVLFIKQIVAFVNVPLFSLIDSNCSMLLFKCQLQTSSITLVEMKLLNLINDVAVRTFVPNKYGV